MSFVYSTEVDQSSYDYEAEDVLVVTEPEQLKALADDVRARLVRLLRERAQSTTQLAEQLGLAKGTIAHHLKVTAAAGLVRVVRTRKVRAFTERYYGRGARVFVLRGDDAADAFGAASVAAIGLRQAAEEFTSAPADSSTFATLQIRLD